MNRDAMLRQVKEDFMLKRIRAEEECDEFINNLRSDKRFDYLYSLLGERQIEMFKQETLELKNEVAELKRKIKQYLAEMNIPYDKLSPHYECIVCCDTGINNGKMCECLLRALNKKITLKTSSQTNFVSFDDCRESIMNDGDKKTRDVLRTWCEKYPDISKININILGGSGMGKTFLLECVANALMAKNVGVVYTTAFELNEMARLYHIGKSFDFANMMDAEVLIIDDLGTEPILKNVTKEYLYNLINIRQINSRPTFISSNLSLDNILDRYDERIFSRLCNKNYSINMQLDSDDKRINGAK